MKDLMSFDEFVNENYGYEFLNEAFNSSVLQNIVSNKRGGIGKAFFDTLSKMGIAASEITNADIDRVDPHAAEKLSKSDPNLILIYFSEKEKVNPYTSESYYKKVEANVPLAVVKGGLYMGLQYDRWASKSKKGEAEYKLVPKKDAGTRLGSAETTKGKYGSNLDSLKRMADVSDAVYVIDPSKVASSIELRKNRKESQAGAMKFISDKDFKQQNMSRYEAILRERAAGDDVDGMVKEAIDSLTDKIKTALEKQIKGRYGDIIVGFDKKGNAESMTNCGYIIQRVLQAYSDYVTYTNNSKESEERWGVKDTYYSNQIKVKAKEIKDQLTYINTITLEK
jgi:hypothetical protein